MFGSFPFRGLSKGSITGQTFEFTDEYVKFEVQGKMKFFTL